MSSLETKTTYDIWKLVAEGYANLQNWKKEKWVRLEDTNAEISKRDAVLEEAKQKILAYYDLLNKKLRENNPEDLLEKLAALEHEQWAQLIQYLIGFAPIHGELTAKEWWRQYDNLSKIPYEDLLEKDKEKDRKFARKVLKLLDPALLLELKTAYTDGPLVVVKEAK